MTIGKMTIDKMTLDKMTIDKMTIDKMTIDKMTIDKMTIDKIHFLVALPFIFLLFRDIDIYAILRNMSVKSQRCLIRTVPLYRFNTGI